MNEPLQSVRKMRGLVDDAKKQLAQLTGDTLAAYAYTFPPLANIEVNAAEIERDIKQTLATAGALPLDVQQLHAIRQMIVGAINRW